MRTGTLATGLFTNRGSKYYPYFVARVSDCPAILTENGFMSNANDVNNMINKNNETAQGIVNGIVSYFEWVRS